MNLEDEREAQLSADPSVRACTCGRWKWKGIWTDDSGKTLEPPPDAYSWTFFCKDCQDGMNGWGQIVSHGRWGQGVQDREGAFAQCTLA